MILTPVGIIFAPANLSGKEFNLEGDLLEINS